MVSASARLMGLMEVSSMEWGSQGVCSQVRVLKKARELTRQKESSVDVFVIVAAATWEARDRLLCAGADTGVGSS